MAIEKVRRRGAYAPLSATYYEDDAIVEAGEKSELLYLRGLAFCAGHPTDGFISDAQINRFVGSGMDELESRKAQLVATNLWVLVPGGILVRAWTKWNKTCAETGFELAKDRDRKRQETLTANEPIVDQGERYSDIDGDKTKMDSARKPSGIDAESSLSPQHSTVQLSTVQRTLALKSTRANDIDELLPGMPEPPAKIKKTRPKITDDDPDFAKFWSLYPRPVDKTNARKAWCSRIRSGTVAADIIAGAERYQRIAKLERDIKFIPYPSTWLNGERWKDEVITEKPIAKRRRAEW